MRRALTLLVSTALLSAGLLASPASAAIIIVNDTGDDIANDNTCTLREAINAANSNTASTDAANGCAAGTGASDTIQFDLSGTPPHTIAVTGTPLRRSRGRSRSTATAPRATEPRRRRRPRRRPSRS